MSEFYLADPVAKRRLFMGKVVGRFLCSWFQDHTEPFASSVIRAALTDFGKRDADERRYDYDPDVFEQFAARIWAFCVTSEWKQEVRWESHEYEDEFLPTPTAWDMPKPDPAWKTIGSWYQRPGLGIDPLSTETAVVLASIG
jgi:hypothetical protein